MINKSLSALGNVINALTDGKSQHIPYRYNTITTQPYKKVTQNLLEFFKKVLEEMLVRHCSHIITFFSYYSRIINCSPSTFNQDESLSTMRFGQRYLLSKHDFHLVEQKQLRTKLELMLREVLLNSRLLWQRVKQRLIG